MGIDRRACEQHNSDMTHQEWAITLHSYSNLTNVSPVVFLYLLKECYVHGTNKATDKFRALRQQVHEVLHNTPRPGPAMFIARCLYVLPIFESYCEGFCHLIISSLQRFLNSGTSQKDLVEAKSFATQLFITAVCGNINHDDKILIKILQVFDIRLRNIENFLSKPDVKNDSSVPTAESFVKRYFLKLIERESYLTGVTLLEHFSISESRETFLFDMLERNQFQAAEKWAEYTEKDKPMIRVLIQAYIDREMLKPAYKLITKHKRQNEFPEVYHKCRESKLKKLAEKGCWDIAEIRAKNDTRLLEFLVYLAMEAGYTEKVDELCDKHSLEGFRKVKEADTNISPTRYLHLDEFSINEIIWVDEANRLNEATHYLEGCKVVGLDCEWKPNYEKGSKNNNVSILQIASEKKVFIVDLIKLYQDVPGLLDDCLSRILHSPRILKLGYNFPCDVKQLADSYGNLECFRHYEKLLDIQNVFKEVKGGLSGLAKSVLGAGLNKTRRNSNWEQRPLTQNQLEYAALDAVVLVRIFMQVRDHSSTTAVSDGHTKVEWTSHISSSHVSLQKTKKRAKTKKKPSKARNDEPRPSS